MQDLLKVTYQNHWPSLKEAMNKEKPSYKISCYPLLLSTTPEFETKWQQAEIKIMLFGISTNGWNDNTKEDLYSIPNEEAVTRLMKLYDNFYHGGENWEYGQVFWNYVYTLEEILSYKLNKKVAIIWNNMYKINEAAWDIEKSTFDVIEEEIKIFEPNSLLVFGMDDADWFIPQFSSESVKWNEVRAKGDKKKPKLYYTVNPNTLEKLPETIKKIIVTYHPNARGNAGIKLKLMLDQLEKELKNEF